MINIKKLTIKNISSLCFIFFLVSYSSDINNNLNKPKKNSFLRNPYFPVSLVLFFPVAYYGISRYIKKINSTVIENRKDESSEINLKEKSLENVPLVESKIEQIQVDFENIDLLKQVELVLEEKSPKLAKNKIGTEELSVLLENEKKYFIQLIRDLKPKYDIAKKNYTSILESYNKDNHNEYTSLEITEDVIENETNEKLHSFIKHMFTLIKTVEYNSALDSYQEEEKKFIKKIFTTSQNLYEKNYYIKKINSLQKKIAKYNFKKKISLDELDQWKILPKATKMLVEAADLMKTNLNEQEQFENLPPTVQMAIETIDSSETSINN